MVENRYAAQILSSRPLEGRSLQVLLIEDSSADARLMQEFLRETTFSYAFSLTHVERLGQGLLQLKNSDYDVVLLDLTLPDSSGLESVTRLLNQLPSIPVVVLTNTNSPELALEAVRRGAQDYLVKRQLHQEVLIRALRYAIERKQQAEALRLANEDLEKRVQARTRELEASNQQLRQEIQHRQLVQERLALAQQAGKAGIFEWNVRSNKVTWSPELEALYGVPQGNFDGRYNQWIQTIHPDDRSRIEQELWRSVSLGSGLNTEFRILHPTSSRWIAVKSSMFSGPDHKPLRMLGIHVDITEKKQLEAQFLQAQRLESLGALASGIAHDLNNILTPILGVGQLLPITLPTVDKRSEQLIQTLNCSAQRGTKLVQQILSFAQGGGGGRRPVAVVELLQEARQIICQTLPQNIQVELDTPEQLWPVLGNDTQLHQVFMNLCVNARDSMQTGGTLKIFAQNLLIDETYLQMSQEANTGPHVVITIADTGTGIDPAVQQHMFEPFFTTKSSSKGSGLGLAAVLSIVKSHGGFINVQTELDQGSQFQIYLPADPGSVPAAPPVLELLQGQRQLVLVVDGEPAVGKVMAVALETYGYEALVAQDGLGAITLLAEHRDEIRCVVIDAAVADINGQTLIPILQRLQPRVKILTMLGAVPTFPDRVEIISGCLTKPFTTQELLIEVHQALSENTSGDS